MFIMILSAIATLLLNFDALSFSPAQVAFQTSHPLTDKHLDTSKSRCKD